jgi:hypothetical protein
MSETKFQQAWREGRPLPPVRKVPPHALVLDGFPAEEQELLEDLFSLGPEQAFRKHGMLIEEPNTESRS